MKRAIFAILLSVFFVGQVFAGNPPDQSKSSITGAATVANGTSWSSVTIVLRDANGDNLTGNDWISITSSASTTTFDPATVSLDGSGTIYTKMRSTSTGNVPVYVYDNTTSTQITGSIVFYAEGTSPPSSSTCTDSAPGSTPVLNTAISKDANSVTLTWTDASDPVTYYLVSYGTSSGNYVYGNPNVGGQGTTSYTVGSLATGVTYYFAIRAGNGCTLGPYSNELSAVAGSTATPTPTSAPTVSPTVAPTVTFATTPTIIPTQASTSTTENFVSNITTPTPTPPLPSIAPLVSQAPAQGIDTVKIVVIVATALGILIILGVAIWIYINYRRSKEQEQQDQEQQVQIY